MAIACWLVNSTLTGVMVKPAISRIAAAAAAVRRSRRTGPRRAAMVAAQVHRDRCAHGERREMLYLMTMKPTLAASLLVVIGVNLAVAALRATCYGFGRTGRSAKPVSATSVPNM